MCSKGFEETVASRSRKCSEFTIASSTLIGENTVCDTSAEFL